MSKEQLAVFRRRKVGFVFQNYNLVPDLNVYENVVLPIELDGKHIDREFVDEILELLQLEEKREALPNTLSGGQQQRVAIARAIASKPGIILADEPTGKSVGMTEKQMRRMLIIEGLLFAGISLFLTATIGTVVTYYLYQSMNYRGVPFMVPILPVFIMAVIVVVVCVAVPLIVERLIGRKKSVVERIRAVE